MSDDLRPDAATVRRQRLENLMERYSRSEMAEMLLDTRYRCTELQHQLRKSLANINLAQTTLKPIDSYVEEL